MFFRKPKPTKSEPAVQPFPKYVERFVVVTAAGVDLFVDCNPGDIVPYPDLFKLWRTLDVVYTRDVMRAFQLVERATLLVTDSKIYYAAPDVAPVVVAEFLKE